VAALWEHRTVRAIPATVREIPETRRRAIAESALLLAVVTWAFGGVFIKLSGFAGITFAFYRLSLGFVVMLVALLVSGRRLTWGVIRASAPGGLFLGLDVCLFFNAVKLTSIADATIIGALQPVLVMLVAGRWFGERIGLREALLAVASVVGVAMVAIGSTGSPVFSLRGDLLAVAALFSWTGYWLVSKKVRATMPALEYMTGVMLTAWFVALPVLLISRASLASTKGTDWLWLILFVVFPAAGGQFVAAWAQRYVEVWISSLLLQAMPVVAAFAAWAVLGEPLTPLIVVGGAVVVAATGAIIVASRSAQPEDAPGAKAEAAPL
jgi:drug/metabolite transporter (DMT)-like permease